jgi:hypothetical protein
MDLSLFLFRLAEVQFFGGWIFGHCGPSYCVISLTRARGSHCAGYQSAAPISWVWLRVATISLVARDLVPFASAQINKLFSSLLRSLSNIHQINITTFTS